MSSRAAVAANMGMSFWKCNPGEPGSGVIFENGVIGGVIPREYIPAVEKGVHESAEGGRDCRLSGHRCDSAPV